MKVCVDIQAAIAQRAGVGRYTKLLVEHLGQQVLSQDELGLFYFDFKRHGEPFPVANATQRSVQWVPGRIVQKAWKSVGFPPFNWFSGGADVFHFPNFIRPPLSKGKSVVTIHDVSFLRYPETLEAKNFAFLSKCIKDTVAKADAIITDCQFVADELRELMDVPEEKLHPILLGLHDIESPGAEQVKTFREQHQLDRPYLLNVGTLEPRKNHLFLIDVFDQLDSFDGDLILAGMKGWKFEPIMERIAASPKADRIRHLDYVADEDLPALYAGAELFVFPSRYEGFGFPPLEAMACGTAVLSSTAGSLAEVLGDGAETLPIENPADWATAIERILGDERLRADCIARGSAKAASYDWAETARQTWDVYRKVAG